MKIYGHSYHSSDFVLCSWQEDDLPRFGQIRDMIVITGTPILAVKLYNTLGINNHLLSYAITSTLQSSVISLSNLVHFQPLSAHTCCGDSNVYIAMRFDISPNIE